jgi:Ca2+-binding RTX toxin-like protein
MTSGFRVTGTTDVYEGDVVTITLVRQGDAIENYEIQFWNTDFGGWGYQPDKYGSESDVTERYYPRKYYLRPGEKTLTVQYQVKDDGLAEGKELNLAHFEAYEIPTNGSAPQWDGSLSWDISSNPYSSYTYGGSWITAINDRTGTPNTQNTNQTSQSTNASTTSNQGIINSGTVNNSGTINTGTINNNTVNVDNSVTNVYNITDNSVNTTTNNSYTSISNIQVNLSALLIGSSSGKDTITGTDSADTIGAGTGADQLVGNGGADQFVFNQKDRFGPRNADIITDFNSEEGDLIALSPKALPGLDSPDFAVASSKSELNTLYRDSANIIYYQPAGQLIYNQNGSGKGFGKGGIFAVALGSPELSASDFGFF